MSFLWTLNLFFILQFNIWTLSHHVCFLLSLVEFQKLFIHYPHLKCNAFMIHRIYVYLQNPNISWFFYWSTWILMWKCWNLIFISELKDSTYNLHISRTFSDMSRVFLDRPIHKSNPWKHHHGWCQVGTFSKQCLQML